jgi:hypothetical protein
MKDRLEAEKEAQRIAAVKLAADIALARAAERAAASLNIFENIYYSTFWQDLKYRFRVRRPYWEYQSYEI